MKTGKIKITVSPDIAAETQASTTQTTMKTGNIKITVSPNIAAETQASTTQTTMKPVTDQSDVDMFQKVLNHVVKIFRF